MSAKTRHHIDDVLIQTLARGETQTEAAKLAGCSARTVARRLEDPNFVGRVDRFRDALLEQSAARLGGLVELAASTLRQLLETKEGSPVVKLGAARTVIDSALKLRDTLLFERRLAALEARVSTESHRDEQGG